MLKLQNSSLPTKEIATPFMISGILCFNNFNITVIFMLLGILNAIKFTKPKNFELLEQNEMRENEYLLIWLLTSFMMANSILFGFNAYFEIGQNRTIANKLEWVSKIVNLIQYVVILALVF